MKYYFCVMIPWEGTDIYEYDTLEELKKSEDNYMRNNNDWYVIKGEVIEL